MMDGWRRIGRMMDGGRRGTRDGRLGLLIRGYDGRGVPELDDQQDQQQEICYGENVAWGSKLVEHKFIDSKFGDVGKEGPRTRHDCKAKKLNCSKNRHV